MKKYYVFSVVLLSALLSFPSAGIAQQTLSCTDRECLIDLVDDYFDALVAHDPDLIPFSNDIHFVENIHHMVLGEGIWQTASAIPSSFKIYIPDPVSKEVGFMGMMGIDGKPELIALRLKVMNGKVSEVEHLITTRLRDSNLINLQAVRPGLLSSIPESERMGRAALVDIAQSYFEALDNNDGDLAPLADDCARRENGTLTSNSGIADHKVAESPNYHGMKCAKQFDSGMFAYIDTIDNIRVPIVDPQTGLAFSLAHFHHGMEEKIIPIYGVKGVKEREVNFKAFDLPTAHIFKISQDKIHEIEAMGFLAPPNSPTGW